MKSTKSESLKKDDSENTSQDPSQDSGADSEESSATNTVLEDLVAQMAEMREQLQEMKVSNQQKEKEIANLKRDQSSSTHDPVQDRINRDLEEQLEIKRILDSEPKVSVFWPLMNGEKEGAQDMVSINGYRYIIQKGIMVEVPKSIAELVKQHVESVTKVPQGHRLNLQNNKDAAREFGVS